MMVTKPLGLTPDWDDVEEGGFVKTAHAVISLDAPRSNPNGPATDLFLEIEEDEDLVEFAWTFGISEEEANFGASEYGSGYSADLEQAKHDCLADAVEFLHVEGYTDEEIAESLTQDGGASQ
jgi:hypothetical protein